jgi:hypothetical protein
MQSVPRDLEDLVGRIAHAAEAMYPELTVTWCQMRRGSIATTATALAHIMTIRIALRPESLVRELLGPPLWTTCSRPGDAGSSEGTPCARVTDVASRRSRTDRD